ncbi:M23 family metallopeptidase [Microbacterium sp. zg-YB36]|uniref:M23 family metallopeptidase n=1 Tax=Microbacterium sp. zg-YB36 TaxID=2969407 RepID=UPI00214D06C6|nr:M23 family metallopeptidase [Microbacterium sp. zg-YB36]MDL5351108.1 M23 family metallopeptidase [Microbacterium sp. zg-YB36]
MRSLVDFWSSQFWGWAFGKPGGSYTIVFGKHIGLDMKRIGDVPALFGGVVVHVERTGTMAWVVVIDTGLPGAWRYHSYCHLAGDRLPRVGQRIGRGERVGRVALGSRDKNSPEWGGTAWDGPHLHFVVGGHPRSAFEMIAGHRTLTAFTDPTILIREALAAPSGGGYTPFEEDDMPFTEAQLRGIVSSEIANYLKKGESGGVPYGYPQATDQKVEDIHNRMFVRAEDGRVLWDYHQDTASRLSALATAFGQLAAGENVDFEALIADMEGRLGASFMQQLADFGVALRAEIVAGLGGVDGATPGEVAAIVDGALAKLTLRAG